jgi:3-oxoacyl-[acyl-carrier-protein] synthase II
MSVMRKTLKDAGVAPEVVEYINCHGTSTPVGDPQEVRRSRRFRRARAQAGDQLHQVDDRPSARRGRRTRGGITALVIRDQVLPPTINLENQDPECDLDCVPNQARKAKVEHALTNSFGFGGTNGALLMRRMP